MRMPQIEIVEKELSYKLTGMFFGIQDKLGRFCREKQYADALESELKKHNLNFSREFPILLEGKKSNLADFLVEGRVIVDLKSKPFVEKGDYYQMRRYLNLSGVRLGLIVNFRHKYLKPKRVLNPNVNSSHYSHGLVSSYRETGFTLVELLVAVAIFSVVSVLAVGGVAKALRAERQTASLLSTVNNASLVMEQMARQIRAGRWFCHTGNPDTSTACGSTSGSASILTFIDSNGDFVTYCASGGAVLESFNSNLSGLVCGDSTFKPITSNNVSVDYLNFVMLGNQSGDGYPPRITILLGVSPAFTDVNIQRPYLKMETTVSARLIDT